MKDQRNDRLNPWRANQQGAALVVTLLSLALLLALAMGISLTAISELGVSNTYANQTIAFQAAEAGLSHATSLTANFNGKDFTELLQLRGDTFSTSYLEGNNPFVAGNVKEFATGAEMIDDNTGGRGHQLRHANGNPVIGASYRVHLIDDEPSGAATLPTVPNFERVAWEDGDPRTDNPNAGGLGRNRVVCYSTGTYANSSITLEGWIGFLPYPALTAEDNITVSGSSDIRGAYGGVHSNGNLTFVGSGAYVEQSATATGTVTGASSSVVGGFFGGGQERLDIPRFVTRDGDDADNDFDADDDQNGSPRLKNYLIRTADQLLVDPGYVDGAHATDPNGLANAGTRRLGSLARRLNVSYASLAAALDQETGSGNVQQGSAAALKIVRGADGSGIATRIDPSSGNPLSGSGWSHNNANGWNISNTSEVDGHTYYVVGVDNYNIANPTSSTRNGGNVKITGNPGPLKATVFATGSIEIEGNPVMESNLAPLQTPELPPFVRVKFLFVAVEDIKIRGDVSAGTFSFTGVTYAGEQVSLSGNGSFTGQVVALSNPDVYANPRSPVPANEITGSFELNFNDGSAIGRIQLLSWRQIKN
jgi:hypothetical protein